MNSLNVRDIIESKSQGSILSPEDIHHFVKCVFEKSIDDAQIGAFLMAIKLRGMNPQETAELTKSMAHFSFRFDWSSYEWRHRVVDKHSTGGVGDKLSHILAPILSSLELKIPMISGRGLGITGGTIDKLESISGFSPITDMENIPVLLDQIGFFITGQTDKMVPVDKQLYAIRDVTATIDSIPLITASILSKKIIEDIKVLLMDIKFGQGAFMKTEEEAENLAKSMMETGKSLKMDIICLIDDMNSPLGGCVGNALEIAEVLRALNGIMHSDIKETLNTMVIQIMKYVDKTLSEDDILRKIDHSISSGKALLKFREMLIAQGAQKEISDKLCVQETLSIKDYLDILNQRSLKETDIAVQEEGFVLSIDAKKIGIVSRDIGAGRQRKEDKINYSVGIELFYKEGDYVRKGEIWAKIYHDAELPSSIIDLVQSAITISTEEIKKITRIKKILISTPN